LAADEYDSFPQSGFRQLTSAIRNNFKNYPLAQLKFKFFQFDRVFLPAIFVDDFRLGDIFAYSAIKASTLSHKPMFMNVE
jgi:hypothetical protein